MCREIALVEIGGKSVEIDRCIADIVRALNVGGVATLASCCGHGKAGRVILDDGRELQIKPFSKERALAEWSTLVLFREIERLSDSRRHD